MPRANFFIVAVVAGLGILQPAVAGAQETAVAGTAGADSDAVFGERVRNYLMTHPEVIMEAVKVLEARQQQAKLEAAKQAVTAQANKIFHDPASPSVGNPEGDVTVVEFFDYNCHYCKRAAPDIAKLLSSDNNIRVVYKEFPILGPGSVMMAHAALAAGKQGKYQPFHDALLSTEGKPDEAQVFAIAASVGLDIERLKQDMADPAIEAQIQENLALARQLNISMTPAFVVADEIVPGAVGYERLRDLINEARIDRLVVN